MSGGHSTWADPSWATAGRISLVEAGLEAEGASRGLAGRWHDYRKDPVPPGPCRADFFRLVCRLIVTQGLRGAKATFGVHTEPWAQDSSKEVKRETMEEVEASSLFLMPVQRPWPSTEPRPKEGLQRGPALERQPRILWPPEETC